MWEFIKILFMSKLVVLTPQPVDINNTYQQKTSIGAINRGASIIMDLSETGICQPNKNVIEAFKCLEDYFSDYEITVQIASEKGKINLHTRSFAISNDNLYIYFGNTGDLNSGMKFNELFISSNIEIPNVIIKWSNAGK